MDKIKDDFDEELDLYMYKEVDGEQVKEKDSEFKEIKKDNIKKMEDEKKIKKTESIKEGKKKKDIKEEKDEEKIRINIKNIKKNISKRRNKKKSWIYTIILLLILSGLVYVNADVIKTWFSNAITGNVVAVVNGEELTSDEFNKIYSSTIEQYPTADRESVLDQTIDKMLLLQESKKKKNNEVSDKEINDFVDEWLNQVKAIFTEEELNKQLELQGTTLEELKEESKKSYKESLIINRLLNETVLKEKDAILPERVKASHILLDNESEANDILKELETRDFNELAAEKSKDTSVISNNGELGWFEKGVMIKEFEDAVFALRIGEISEPVKTGFGYHIIKLEDKKGEEKKKMSELDSEERSLVLSELQDAVNDYIKELRNKADIKIYSMEEKKENENEIPAATGLVEKEINADIKTFEETEDDICKEDGKPLIRLFSTTWCPHCEWIKETFDNTVKEYVDEGKIVAYHWELDINDNTLTEEAEKEVPESEKNIFSKYNPDGGIPTFVFGCKYLRIGNGYEAKQDLASEDAEFRAVIEELIQ